MRTYKCDRCDKEFAESRPTDPPTPPSEDPRKAGLIIKLPIIVRGNRIVVVETDLCGPCTASLCEWLSKVKI